ncbi:rab-like protein 3 [Sarcoptes scabiei]|nr:rab-like protein 3 [Sarcoptes scabiei]
MSDRGMNPFIKAFRNFLNSFKLRGAQTKPVMIVGTDLHGNKYFESKDSNQAKPKRFYLPSHPDLWDKPIPAEWNAWLRFQRKDPPTKAESQQNQMKIENLKEQYSKKIEMEGQKFPVYEEYEQTVGSKYKNE